MAEKIDLQGEKCLLCGHDLDTGWECNYCGWDGIEWYAPYHIKGEDAL